MHQHTLRLLPKRLDLCMIHDGSGILAGIIGLRLSQQRGCERPGPQIWFLAAAVKGDFFKILARLHPRGRFP